MAKVSRRGLECWVANNHPITFDASTLTQKIPVRFVLHPERKEPTHELGEIVILHYRGAVLPIPFTSPYLRVYGVNPKDKGPLYPTKIQVREFASLRDDPVIAEYTQPPYFPPK
jgi:hypothetical protein